MQAFQQACGTRVVIDGKSCITNIPDKAFYDKCFIYSETKSKRIKDNVTWRPMDDEWKARCKESSFWFQNTLDEMKQMCPHMDNRLFDLRNKLIEFADKDIDKIAETCREMLGIKAPVTLEELKTSIQNLGIILTPKSDLMDIDEHVIRRGALDYEIFYNPKQSEQTQLWNLANSLGKIMLFGFPQDFDKNIYNGNFKLLSEHGDIVNPQEIFHDIDILKAELKRCDSLDDAKHRLKNFFKDESPNEYRTVNVYDFHQESMFRIRKDCINPAYNMIYYMKIMKN